MDIGSAQAGDTAPAGTALRYRVGGMDCPSCAGKIETALNRLAGAEGVHINHQTGLLVLELDERATPRARVELQVRRLGFDIRPVDVLAIEPGVADPGEATIATEPTWWNGAKSRLFLAIGTLLLGGIAFGHAVPEAGPWAALPAVALGLFVFGRKAIALARAGSPFSPNFPVFFG
jgi:Cd2+/Zn2+-exporting ATPase